MYTNRNYFRFMRIFKAEQRVIRSLNHACNKCKESKHRRISEGDLPHSQRRMSPVGNGSQPPPIKTGDICAHHIKFQKTMQCYFKLIGPVPLLDKYLRCQFSSNFIFDTAYNDMVRKKATVHAVRLIHEFCCGAMQVNGGLAMLYVYHQIYRPTLSEDRKTVTLVHFGEYRYLSEAYCAMRRFISDNMLKAVGDVSEEYIRNENNTPFCGDYVTKLTVGTEA